MHNINYVTVKRSDKKKKRSLLSDDVHLLTVGHKYL